MRNSSDENRNHNQFRRDTLLRWLEEVKSRNTTFHLVGEQDAKFILSLRLDKRLSTYVSQVEDDLQKQTEWILNYKTREERGNEFYFIILHNNEQVGTVRLYDFQAESFSWGSWMIKPGISPRAAVRSLDMVYELAFHHLHFANSHFEVRQGNTSVWSFHEKTGARLASQSDQDRFYTLRASDYLSPIKR